MHAYQDIPLSLNFNVVISAPCLHASCLTYMESVLKPGASVLDVGCGSGYLCAALYEMTKKEDGMANVVGIEHVDVLAQFSYDNLYKNYQTPLENGSIKIVCGDGRLGYKDCALFDAINVGAASD